MNNRQKTGLAIIIAGLLVIAAIIYFIFMRPVEQLEPIAPVDVPSGQLPGEPEESDLTPGNTPRRNTYDLSSETPHETNATDVAKLASIIAERLGSFSNQSNYSNFEDLNIFMTTTMRDWAKTYVEKMRTDNPYEGNYYGISTFSVNTSVKSFDNNNGNAEVVVGTLRRETKVDGSESEFNQDLRLVFVKEGDRWLVDGAYWLK
ncbi:hypothetical protein CVU83_00780 [Candidatus Falkowbacteria bacterium HGW-Falkowbacteria-2]|uniref:Uncharacterized protein n=1 Tax=Candidatus Falkowbacteria bacterium HGW-Falkowbacteria-2 TaxID=2013769 RepID=A0A2N2E2T9_9BACT|nr:MAG: hypothetical protein CVU83_00780 [Candidatus Falkowbacteria bacterium HGW-Falkowbacteria-2]